MVSVDVEHHVYLLTHVHLHCNTAPELCACMDVHALTIVASDKMFAMYKYFIIIIIRHLAIKPWRAPCILLSDPSKPACQHKTCGRRSCVVDDDDELMLNVLRCQLTY